MMLRDEWLVLVHIRWVLVKMHVVGIFTDCTQWSEKLTHGVKMASSRYGFLSVSLNPAGWGPYHGGWGFLFPICTEKGPNWIQLVFFENFWCKCFNDKSGSVSFEGWMLKSVKSDGLRMSVSLGGVRCAAADVAWSRCRRRRWRTRRKEWGNAEDEEQQKYSAVIHKVESTTKLLATV